MSFLLRALVFACAAYFALKLLRRLLGGASRVQPPAASAAQSSKPALSQAMVACAHCGLYIPQHEALMQSEQTFCSTQHAEQHRI